MDFIRHGPILRITTLMALLFAQIPLWAEKERAPSDFHFSLAFSYNVFDGGNFPNTNDTGDGLRVMGSYFILPELRLSLATTAAYYDGNNYSYVIGIGPTVHYHPKFLDFEIVYAYLGAGIWSTFVDRMNYFSGEQTLSPGLDSGLAIRIADISLFLEHTYQINRVTIRRGEAILDSHSYFFGLRFPL